MIQTQEQKQSEKYNINYVEKEGMEKKLLFHVEQGIVNDIVEKVLKAKGEFETENKDSQAKNEINDTLKGIMSALLFLFGVVCICMVVVAGLTLWQVFKYHHEQSYYQFIVNLAMCASLGIICFYCGIVSFRIKKVVKNITDKNYMVSLFSSIVAMAAFLVSCIGFFYSK